VLAGFVTYRTPFEAGSVLPCAVGGVTVLSGPVARSRSAHPPGVLRRSAKERRFDPGQPPRERKTFREVPARKPFQAPERGDEE
jgi:hypothetical protein